MTMNNVGVLKIMGWFLYCLGILIHLLTAISGENITWNNWSQWMCQSTAKGWSASRYRHGLQCNDTCTSINETQHTVSVSFWQWSGWSAWTSQLHPCSERNRTRSRTCVLVKEDSSNITCEQCEEGKREEQEQCAGTIQSWSSWSSWSSMICPNTVAVRSRTCSKPTPSSELVIRYCNFSDVEITNKVVVCPDSQTHLIAVITVISTVTIICLILVLIFTLLCIREWRRRQIYHISKRDTIDTIYANDIALSSINKSCIIPPEKLCNSGIPPLGMSVISTTKLRDEIATSVWTNDTESSNNENELK